MTPQGSLRVSRFLRLAMSVAVGTGVFLALGIRVAGGQGAHAIMTPQRGQESDSIPATAVGPDSVSSFGDASSAQTGVLTGLTASIVDIDAVPHGVGYWLVASDGGVFSKGGAGFFGSAGGTHLVAPVVGMAATPDSLGYWLVGADGGVFAFGDAGFFGSLGGSALDAQIVGIAATPDGLGYWLVGADGGIFTFGDAGFFGSTGGVTLNRPIVGMASTADGGGYRLVASDGGVFTFGDAGFFGSAGTLTLDSPVVGMASASGGLGYWLVAADGGIFSYGNASFHGSDAGDLESGGTTGGTGGTPGPPVVGMAATPDGGGYWLATGAAPDLAGAIGAYVAGRSDNVTAAVYDIRSGLTSTYRAGVVEHTASTLKVDILATLLARTQANGPLTASDQALAVPMIEESLTSAADALWGQTGPGAVGAFERAAGLTSTVPATDGIWGTTTTTATDRLAMLKTIVFPNPLLVQASRDDVLNLMEHVTPTQDWGATGGVPPGVQVALKNGFAPIVGWQINTTGWVDGDGRDYLIAVLTDGNSTETYGIQTVNGVSSIIWSAL